TIVSTNGVFSWPTTDSDANSTKTITVRVTDNGSPPRDDSKTFSIIVLSRPMIQSVSVSGGMITLTWSAISGTTYRVQVKDDLNDANWTDLSDVPATGATAMATDLATAAQR